VAFIPLYDGTPYRYIRRPFVTWGLLAANILVFFLVEHGTWSDANSTAIGSFGIIPALFDNIFRRPSYFVQIPEWSVLLTYSFFHADFLHLAGNMIFLWVFADNVEDAMGHLRFFLFYMLCSAGSGAAYIISDPAGQAPMIGASGAIAGVVAAYFILLPNAKIWILALDIIPLHIRAVWVLGFWVLFQVYAFLFAGNGDLVAWPVHLGGLVCGAILVLFLRRPGVPLFYRPPPPEPPAVEEL
jgi:membrane associated rhomboid family serine protease